MIKPFYKPGMMNKLYLFFAGAMFLLFSPVLRAQVSIGGYNVYYGHLHNHCSYSDGSGTASQAYAYARDNGQLDFFSLADHETALTAAEYAEMMSVANSYNQDGEFTTFYGFEWSHSTYGHVAVIGSTELCFSGTSPTNTFTGLVNWLSTRDVIAFFNHPGRQNSTGVEFNHFSGTPTDKFVGMELWNKGDRFEDYYYTDGYYANDGNKSWYDEAQARGWKIGASGSEDNHVATWGTYTNSKMAVLASAKTRADIMAALKARRFYSTYDKNLALSFKINGSEMGSTVTGGSQEVHILAGDATGDLFTAVELLKNGTVIYSWTPGTTNVNLSQTIGCSDGEYYYVRVKQSDGDEAITSPIWISGGISNLSPTVSITSPANNADYTLPADVTITAGASDGDGTVMKVTFYQGTTLLGEDTSAPFSYTWTNVPAGAYVLTALATDDFGSVTPSAPVNITVTDPDAPVVVSRVIAASSDDAEENSAGTVNLTSTDMELAYDGSSQVVGLRFTNMNIPQGAVIHDAYVQFTCDEASTTSVALTIRGEAADQPATFTTATRNISSRSMTAGLVSWSPAGWPSVGAAGTDQRTPDLSAIIQEIVDRPGYTTSSALALIITGTGTGKRVAEARDGVAASAPKLVVAYKTVQEIIPLFQHPGPLCQYTAPPALPQSSLNEPPITGSWAPAVISTSEAGTNVYTFTPDANQNAVSLTLAITVNPRVTPDFSAIGPLVQGSAAPSLPVVSLNGISGTWEPALINTANAGSFNYLFTPAAEECATAVSMEIVITSATPPNVALTAPADGTGYTAPADVTLTADASDSDGSVAKVAFYHGNVLLGVDSSAPYAFTWNNVPEGNYVLTAVATDNSGASTVSAPVNIAVTEPVSSTFTAGISAGMDDVEEYASGTVSANNDDLELVYDTKTTGNQTVGLRFNGIEIPQGAVITRAYLQFTVDEKTTTKTSLVIRGQNSGNAPAFTTTSRNVSGRSKTAASVSWVPANWIVIGTAGTAQQTPSLAGVVQEIVNRTDWSAGNSMAFIITGSGKRTAESFEGDPSKAALLYLEFTTSLKNGIRMTAAIPERGESPDRPGRLTCYPVPFVEFLKIRFEPGERETAERFKIIDSAGRTVKTLKMNSAETTVPTRELVPGVYVLKVFTNRASYSRTIVK